MKQEDMDTHMGEGLQEQAPEHKKLKKIFKITITAFLFLLFISYFVIGPNGLSIIAGFSETNIINENNLYAEKGGISIQFTGEVYKELKHLFEINEGQEFKACIKGEKIGNNYFANEVFIPETYEQTLRSVRAAPCPKETVIDLHSHPLNSCVPSFHDIQNIRRVKQEDQNRILGVMCTLERFTFYP